MAEAKEAKAGKKAKAAKEPEAGVVRPRAEPVSNRACTSISAKSSARP